MKHLGTFSLLFGLWALPAQAADSDADGIDDALDVYPCDPALAGAAYAPAKGQHGGLLFEDQWPARGDGDFNDAVLTYNYVMRTTPSGEVEQIVATFNVLALGGVYDNALGLHVEVPAADVASITRRTAAGTVSLSARGEDAELTIDVVSDLRSLFGGQAGQINSVSGPALTGQTVEVTITLATPAPASLIANAPFDVFLYHAFDHSNEIHRPMYTGTARMDSNLFGNYDDGSTPGRAFVDRAGAPYALDIPVFDTWPAEGENITQLWPDILTFASSGGLLGQDFYVSTVDSAFAFAGTPAPQPDFLQGHDFVDITCGPPTGESFFEVLETFDSVLTDGYHTFTVGGQTMPVELVTFEGDKVFTANASLGDTVADARTLVVRVHGNLTVNSGVSVTAAARKRGMMFYVTGDAQVAGTVTMTARGAIAAGQNVYLARDTSDALLYVSASGGGGAGRQTSTGPNRNGGAGGASALSSGGGGAGAVHCNSCTAKSGAGSAGTSWSGGAGGGGASRLGSSGNAANGVANGGAGGAGSAYQGTPWGKAGGGGAGNNGGAARRSGNASASNGSNGTGGLLVMFAKGAFTLTGSLQSKGSNGGGTSTGYYVWSAGGGASGGGSIHVFYGTSYTGGGTMITTGGTGGRGYCGTASTYCLYGGAGGTGGARTAQLSLGQ